MNGPEYARAVLLTLGHTITLYLGSDQILNHRGNQGSGKDVGSHHGQRDRQSQGREQILRRSRQENHWDKHNADAERRNKRRHGDLLRAVENRAHNRFSLPQIAMNVLNFDGSVIHQNTHGKREAAECHYVDGFIQQVQNGQGRQNGEGNRDTHDQRASPAAEKKQNHQRSQQSGDHRFLENAIDRRPYKDGLVEEQL